jgi:hypothetical protein
MGGQSNNGLTASPRTLSELPTTETRSPDVAANKILAARRQRATIEALCRGIDIRGGTDRSAERREVTGALRRSLALREELAAPHSHRDATRIYYSGTLTAEAG